MLSSQVATTERMSHEERVSRTHLFTASLSPARASFTQSAHTGVSQASMAADAATEKLRTSTAAQTERIAQLESALVAAREERGETDGFSVAVGLEVGRTAAAEHAAAMQAATAEVAQLTEKLTARDVELTQQAETMGAADAEIDELLSLLSRAEQRLGQVEATVFDKVSQVEALVAATATTRRGGADDVDGGGGGGGAAEATTVAEHIRQQLREAHERLAADEEHELQRELDVARAEARQAEAAAAEEADAAERVRQQLREAHERLAVQETLMRSRTDALVSSQAQVAQFRSSGDGGTPPNGSGHGHASSSPHEPEFKRRLLLAGGRFLKVRFFEQHRIGDVYVCERETSKKDPQP